MRHAYKAIVVGVFAICTHLVAAEDPVPGVISLDDYMEKLQREVTIGGRLYCQDKFEEENFKDCKSFNSLKARGCYGETTRDMSVENRYENTCKEIEALQRASTSTIDHFDLKSKDWWRSIPAEVIPMPGGIYTDKLWEKEKLNREELVKGKLLGQLDFLKLVVGLSSIEAVIGSTKSECGETHDTLRIAAVLLADFDGDGIAELLLQGYRLDDSDSCLLGSGNSMGAAFSALVKKSNPTSTPIVMNYPNVD